MSTYHVRTNGRYRSGKRVLLFVKPHRRGWHIEIGPFAFGWWRV